ncbi:ADP-ribosylglycohydrolase family protein [Micromonospora auratinigra]|uniref:ADP-ribosylglycohydrolase n=1 Tax=Micromonospora auratinigra TaxID=261654 RepID=A0A1A8ZF20_9ACTN|nr:ADP-ribosylglycohydrolase family protein [Micromonospora auratinigra]SBT42464.1 ADP-ribosylglycohydrolase [Micromonospora auratinigra]
MTGTAVRQLATARGCLLGLLLGDAIGAVAGTVPIDGPLRSTSAGQLACFTVEGVIRANLRSTHRGICHSASVVRHAYTRWAALQGAPGIHRWREDHWPDGWLAQVPAIAAHRGTAPATVSALQRHAFVGSTDHPDWTSTGAHALTRTLPVGLTAWWGGQAGRYAGDLAATTHAPEAVDAALVGAAVVAGAGRSGNVATAVAQARQEGQELVRVMPGTTLSAAVEAADERPRRADVLTQLAPDGRAASALAGGVYVALSFPERGRLRDALLLAGSVPHGEHVAATAGAILGSAHGVDALPLELVSRLELAWVADVLARDLVAEFTDSPAGNGYRPAADPEWLTRYPGW